MRHLLARLAAAVLVTAAAGVVTGAPAQAAACSGSTGVTVVVDFHELGGGVQQGCVADGAGRDASVLFESAGFALTRVQNQPGFVCRVRGLPADDPCVRTPPSTAYWALWSSTGTSGSWDYASLGVDGLSVPDGGSVAFSWKQGAAASQPGVAPPVRAAAPAPTPSAAATPSARATKKPITRPTVGPRGTRKPEPTPVPSPAGPTVTPTASASLSPSPSAEQPTAASATPSAEPSVTYSGSFEPLGPEATLTGATATASAAAPAGTPTSENDDGGLPTWVGPVLVVLVFGAAGAVAVVRRRRTTDPSG